MKTMLLAATLIVGLTVSAAAAKKPAPSQHLAGSDEASTLAAPGIPPTLCDPCLFYGGDINPASPNAAGLSDENTLLILGGSSTYASFTLKEISASVTGIVFNLQADANFDPQTATYDVRTGVTEGNGGTSVASGTSNISLAATGRNFLGLNEYTVAVQLSAPLLIGPGEYWFNLTPACTNGNQDGSCSVGRILLSNTTNRANNVNGAAQVRGQMFVNSIFFDFTYANWCDSTFGLNAHQCAGASFGLIGSLVK
ncbi:MAG: hypothetical protein ABR880_05105 [Candidatus Sulfotelmatobacter sp.]